MTRILEELQNVPSDGVYVSLYIPAKFSEPRERVSKRFRRQMDKARDLLETVLSPDEAKGFLEQLENAYKNVKSREFDRGLGLFGFKDRVSRVILNEVPPELTVVADSFHVKPLLRCSITNLNALVVMVTAQQITSFLLDDGGIHRQHRFINDLDSVDGLRRLGLVGNRLRSKQLHERFIKTKALELSQMESLYRRNIAILGSKVLRQRLAKELESSYGANVFYDSEISPCLEQIQTEVSEILRMQIRRQESAMASSLTLDAHGKLGSRDLADIARAAVNGRVETLIINSSTQIWGRFDRQTGAIRVARPNQQVAEDCILDDIAQVIHSYQGRVLFIDHESDPSQPQYSAIYRW
ncbi:hypothetical protein [Pseudobacteriovorax antillogorgiicola]|nr:hypothetical protein [Pseudobacteriovorax antillogorgiicola]